MADDVIFSTRREFLTGTLGTISLASTMPGFLARTAQAMIPERKDHGRILVVLQLSGGNDGLNTVVPYAMDAYYQARPLLAIKPDECLKVDDTVGLHPGAQGLKALFDDGRLAIVQGIGYPNPNRSHFKSMDIWHTADPSGRQYTGWLGRYFDACCSGTAAPDPQTGIALLQESPLALSGERFAPLAFQSPEDLRWRSKDAGKRGRQVFATLNEGVPPDSDSKRRGRKDNAALDYLRRAALQARMGAAEVRAAAAGIDGRFKGRGRGLQRQLALVRAMITAEFPTRVYYVSAGGFDTHSGQSGRHRQLMTELGDSVKWFVERLKADQLLDRVLLMTFSEFGRRVAENASGGTDHGTAAPMFLVGAGVKPGVHLEHPSLGQLDPGGDLIFKCDFRQVYATVLRDWLGANHKKILQGQFRPLKILRR